MPNLPVPVPKQVEWQNLELGMFIHWAPNVYHEAQIDKLVTPLDEINPYLFSADEWVQTALDIGAKYIILVCKHCGGFCLWQTDTTKYSIKNTPFQDGNGDIVRDVADACTKNGLKMGVYLCPRDDYFGALDAGVTKDPSKQAEYDSIYRTQLTELLSQYGEMMEVWFDGSSYCDIGDILEKYAPNAVCFQSKHAGIRWVGNEDGMAKYPAWNSIMLEDKLSGVSTQIHSNINGNSWLPMECDTTIRSDWFWSQENHTTLKSLDELMEIYYRSVGNGCGLLLNANPDREGRIPEADAARAKEFGDEIKRRFSCPIARTSGIGNTFELDLKSAQSIDHVVFMEDIALGERVRLYELLGCEGGEWFTIKRGTAIGHKHIEWFSPITAEKLRLVIVKAADTPNICDFSVYYTGIPYDEKMEDRDNSRDYFTIFGWGSEVFWRNPNPDRSFFTIDIDLSGVITTPADVGQYEIKIVASEDFDLIEQAVVIAGMDYPDYIRKTGLNTLSLYIPGAGNETHVRLKSKTPNRHSKGQVMIRKL